jgi:acyl transferase domain-containing protein
VSAFGVGGTNAHVIVEEAPVRAPAAAADEWAVVVWSGKTAAAREATGAQLARWFARDDTATLADAAYTLQTGRQAMAWRGAVVCRTRAEAAEALATGTVTVNAGDEGEPSVVLAIPGQGAQRAGMGRVLYAAEPVYRAAIDRCAAAVAGEWREDLRTVLFEHDAAALAETAVAQPVLFATAYAVAQQWAAWGVRPAALLGHSVGEYVAACLAGVLTVEDAMRLVAIRGRLMQAMPRGTMVAVEGSEAAVQAALAPGVWVAAVNGATRWTLGGEPAAMATVAARLQAAGLLVQPLATSHAYHTPQLAGMVEAYVAAVAAVRREPPQVPYVSTVTGTWATAAQVQRVTEELFPKGTEGIDQGEVLKAVFLHLKRKNSADNVRR